MTKEAEWDVEATYDEQISPLMLQIIAICKEHRIPMAATFVLNDEGMRCTTTLPFEPRGDEKLTRTIQAMSPERPIVLAETHITNPDGSKTISIRRMA
jgi:hypothetical protein